VVETQPVGFGDVGDNDVVDVEMFSRTRTDRYKEEAGIGNLQRRRQCGGQRPLLTTHFHVSDPTANVDQHGSLTQASARGLSQSVQERQRVLERGFDERRPVRHALGRDDCAPQPFDGQRAFVRTSAPREPS
jgi:hypothetical protein